MQVRKIKADQIVKFMILIILPYISKGGAKVVQYTQTESYRLSAGEDDPIRGSQVLVVGETLS